MTTQKNAQAWPVRAGGGLATYRRPRVEIRGMLRRGELTYVVAGRKIDPVSVRRLLESDYARLVLDMLLSEDVTAPVPQQRYAAPAPLYPGVLEFAPATGFLAPQDEVEPERDAPTCPAGRDLLRPATT